jgi:hypothetical protein
MDWEALFVSVAVSPGIHSMSVESKRCRLTLTDKFFSWRGGILVSFVDVKRPAVEGRWDEGVEGLVACGVLEVRLWVGLVIASSSSKQLKNLYESDLFTCGDYLSG